MKLMILGASNAQVNAIKRAREMGYKVIAADYYENSPGKRIADEAVLASTFDYEAILHSAKEFKINGIMTTGTDQPVYVVNRVAEQLNLPKFLSAKIGYNVTNKRAMKKILTDNNIPVVPYKLINKDFNEADICKIKPPYVLKPIDSQGQRGIYKVNTFEEINYYIKDTLSYSREKEVLLESYYKSDEVTVSGWVTNSKLKVLTITDRVTFSDDLHIGICSSHEFPSVYFKEYGEEIIQLSDRIVKAFKIQNGPVYFQLLIGEEGILVNEIACRIGGAYEDEFIPLITGVDILKMVIDYSMGRQVNYESLENYSIKDNQNYLSCQLFFANEGIIKDLTSINEIIELDGVYNAGYNFSIGDIITPRVNATQRAGYMIITGSNENQLINNINKAYDKLYITNEEGKNLVIRGNRGKIK